ncbi:MFS transporter [Ferrimonas marina]|uniref:Sugar phosphate permease n=1 Tax=Ferrimonas marina TaxID=299255 RepID=A0A1M5MPE3_9GAMM|nr:MFS transporter [Ferrimonas marina]SHG79105.1 Sugar phosphate permease [Ferrimonas marina]
MEQLASARSRQWLQLGQRWRMAWVLGISVFIGYLDRLNISFAVPLLADEMGWTSAQTQEYGSLLMSLFYVGYGLGNLFLTPVASRFGPRKSLLVIVLLWSLFTAMGAMLSQWLLVFAASRILLGLAEGPHFPMMSALTKRWFPPNERARANSCWIAGLFLAMLAAPMLFVPLMNAFGWRSGFYVLAILGALITWPLIYWLVKDNPRQCHRTDNDERRHIETGLQAEQTLTEDGQRWHQLLRNPTFALLLLGGMLNNIVGLGLVSWLPTYFTEQKGILYNELSWLIPLPFIFSLVGVAIWSQLGDRSNRRSQLAGLGYFIAAIAIYVALSADSLWLTVVGFCSATASISAFTAAEFSLVQRVLPPSSVANGVGLYNGLSTMVGGGLGPVIVAPIIGDGGGTAVVSVVALINSALFLLLYRRLRY